MSQIPEHLPTRYSWTLDTYTDCVYTKRMAESTLRSVAAVIKALDGPSALARRLNRTPQQVCNWKSEGMFPDWTYPVLIAFLEKKGHTAPRKLWRRLAKFAEAAE